MTIDERPSWEILVGSTKLLDYLATTYRPQPHPLQDLVREVIAEELDEEEYEIFFLRFGEQLPIRTIAEMMEYKGHRKVQTKLENILKKVREGIERRQADESIHNSTD